ncbi:MAG: hypothetical protein LCH61_19805, partial [Proteobacteria bacterium]|nr:hypothetical protein [Pseudomonadota bacterium]
MVSVALNSGNSSSDAHRAILAGGVRTGKNAGQSAKRKPKGSGKTKFDGPRSILLIAGMHRSGTSALTRILNLQGISLPGDLLDAAVDNPTGFWENKRIIDFHTRFFEGFGVHSEDMLALPKDWLSSANARSAIEELRGIISEEYAAYPISVVKDPRICRLLPLWYEALEPLGLEAKTVLPVRYPFDVAASLQTRNQLSLVHGLLTWLDHVTAAEFDSRGRVRSIVTFEAVMSDWQAVTERIASDLGIVFPRTANQSSADVANFLSADLVHHSRKDAEADPRIGSMALEAWESLCTLALDPSDAAAQEALDTIRVELPGIARPLADIANALEKKAREAIALVVAADKTRREWYEPEIARLQKAWAEQDHVKRTWFEPELERRDEHIAALKTEIARLEQIGAENERVKKEWFEPEIERRDDEIASLKAGLAYRDTQVAEMKAEVERMAAQSRADAQAKEDWFASVVAQNARHTTRLKAQLDRLTKLATETRLSQEAALDRVTKTLTIERMEERRIFRIEVERLRSELAATQAQLIAAHQNVANVALTAHTGALKAVDAPPSPLSERFSSRGASIPYKDGPALGQVARYARKHLRRLAIRSSERRLVEASGLFDENWYRQHTSDLGGADPLSHYLKFGGEHRISPSPGFDAEWYLSTNPDVRQSGMNPLVHYLRFGIAEGRQPAPNAVQHPPAPPLSGRDKALQSQWDRALLANSRLFDAEWYLQAYPDIQGMDPLNHYLDYGGREGRWQSPHFNGGKYAAFNPDVVAADQNPLVHYLRWGRNEGRQAGLSMPILSTIRSTIEDLRAIEPEIAGEAAFVQPDWLQCFESYRPLPLNVAWNKIFNSLKRPYDHIIFIPWFMRGGAEQEAAYVAKLAIDKLGSNSVLVVATTNERREGMDWFPDTADKLILSDIEPQLTHDDRVRLVEMLIYAIRPKAVLNVNSHALWDAIMRRGVALSNISDLHALIFCKDYGPDGRPGGYLDTHFRACLPHLRRVYSDNATLIDELTEEFGLTAGMRNKLAFV